LFFCIMLNYITAALALLLFKNESPYDPHAIE
jgi:hypothetical protein